MRERLSEAPRNAVAVGAVVRPAKREGAEAGRPRGPVVWRGRGVSQGAGGGAAGGAGCAGRGGRA